MTSYLLAINVTLRKLFEICVSQFPQYKMGVLEVSDGVALRIKCVFTLIYLIKH